jgi:pimeloyl-ACP methyl ester carboxylesterase
MNKLLSSRKTSVAALLSSAAVAVAAPLALGACGGTGYSANMKGSPSWQPCPNDAEVECAGLRVPVDWSRPGGAKLRLNLARLPATDPRHRIGSLLFNCGGPGGPCAMEIQDYGFKVVFSERLRARFDVVTWDPRGIGKSKPLQCGRPWFYPGAHVYPSTAQEFDELMSRNRALARSCRRMSGPLANNVGAPSTVRDMEAIRRALGDGKLNYLGLSYGTLLGAAYAQRYPRRVRTLALDGALENSLPQPVMLANEAAAAEDVFDRWAAWCQQEPSCPLHGQDVAAVYDHLIAAANRSPIPASNVGRPVSGEEIQNNTDANYLLFENKPLIPREPSWDDLGTAIVAAKNGDASYFATYAPGPPSDSFYGGYAVGCLDFPSQARTFADLRRFGLLAAAVGPHLGGASQTGQIASQCIGWPHPKYDPRRLLRVRGAPPVLIVNATHDPSTTYEWALSLHTEIKPSRVLTREGNGHTSYPVSSCARGLIDTYLISRALPEPGATCSP